MLAQAVSALAQEAEGRMDRRGGSPLPPPPTASSGRRQRSSPNGLVNKVRKVDAISPCFAKIVHRDSQPLAGWREAFAPGDWAPVQPDRMSRNCRATMRSQFRDA